jgi:hypothetical protein
LFIVYQFAGAHSTLEIKYLYEFLREFDVPKKLVNLAEMTLINSNCRVRIQGQVSNNFKVNMGLRKGDSLTDTLFSVVLRKAIEILKLTVKEPL